MRFALAALLIGLPASSTVAQVPDHLECYKVRDPAAKAHYTADLSASPPLPPASGCRIRVPAKLVCVPTAKTNVQPAPPGGGGSGTSSAFACYTAKCPVDALPALPATDQFGARTVQPTRTKLLCAPLAPPTTTTTTTTTLPLPTCGLSAFPTCNGTCPPGDPPCEPLDVPDFTGCRCPPVQCGTYPTCGGACPPGKVCVGFALPGFAECGCFPPP
jgi:hypothetical protein